MTAENSVNSLPEPKFNRGIFQIELVIVLIVALLYGRTLLSQDPNALQQTGEHNESATLWILVDESFKKYGEFPRWNPYMLTGFPHVGDPLTQFINPLLLIPTIILGAIPGMRMSVFVAFFLAGAGQLILGYVLHFRFVVRLWAALLFMLSGGLAMLWRIGWVGLINGVMWFPFCLAFVLWALDSRRRLPIGLAAISITLLFMSGSAYWLLYFLGSLLVIMLFKIIASRFENRSWGSIRTIIYRLVLIGLLSMGLAGVYILPLTDSWAYMSKEAPADKEQKGSQPISQALFNYLVDDFEYYRSGVLGKVASGSWMYIGSVPFVLLVFVPLSYTKSKRKSTLLLMATLVIVLLAWQANKYTPIGLIYEKIPFLYQFRLPNRILVIATSPLIALASFGLGYIDGQFRQIKGTIGYIPTLGKNQEKEVKGLSISRLLQTGLIIILVYTTYGVFRINRSFAFDQESLNTTAEETLAWLRKYDPEVYYINIGNWPIIWSWMPAAYQHEHKVINFEYGRVLKSWGHQKELNTPLKATPKYIIATSEKEPDSPSKIVNSFGDMNVYQMLDSLPYAFEIAKDELTAGKSISPQIVESLAPQSDGPNRIVVQASTQDKDRYIVLLESYYPGWHVVADGKPQTLVKIGDYLGVQAQPGNHQYIFSFKPAKFTWGMAISIISFIIVILYMLSDRYGFTAIFHNRFSYVVRSARRQPFQGDEPNE